MKRLKIYGMMMLGAMLLMTSCSSEDATKEVAPQEAIAISFGCSYEDDEEENITRAGHQGVMNTEDLYATGFGVMASVTAGTEAPYDNKPNMMYNQEVSFTFVGDLKELLDPEHPELGVKKGYWSYQPVKYWPTDLAHCYISAYAPYQELPIADPETTMGIYGLSTNSEVPYVDYRRCDNPEEVVDLLWYYERFAANDKIPGLGTSKAGILDMKMRHALARLEIKVALKEGTVLPTGTKVLIEKIILTGKMAKTGRLSLCSPPIPVIENKDTEDEWTRLCPVWSNQKYDKNGSGVDTERTIKIKNEENDAESYGIIDSQVRYIPGMPYLWQPEGLKVYNPSAPKGTDNGLRNALSTGDRMGFIYLIPQEKLELTVKVKYHKMTSGSDVTGVKTTLEAETPITISPLYGNKPYSLNIKLSDI